MQPEILLVDDDKAILDLSVFVLQEAGYGVTAVGSGDIALVILEQDLRFRLLITDVVLPGFFDGFALARKAKTLVPDIAIIYTTGYGSGIVRVRSQGAPYGEVLAKPWKSSELLKLTGFMIGLPLHA